MKKNSKTLSKILLKTTLLSQDTICKITLKTNELSIPDIRAWTRIITHISCFTYLLCLYFMSRIRIDALTSMSMTSYRQMELKFWYNLTRKFWCNWVILGKTRNNYKLTDRILGKISFNEVRGGLSIAPRATPELKYTRCNYYYSEMKSIASSIISCI